jgi:hypothetical protein
MAKLLHYGWSGGEGGGAIILPFERKYFKKFLMVRISLFETIFLIRYVRSRGYRIYRNG